MDQDGRPDICEFDRVLFGMNSLPFQAQFVLQQHAKQHHRDFPMAAETVLKSTCMDDSMDSVLNEDLSCWQQLACVLGNGCQTLPM